MSVELTHAHVLAEVRAILREAWRHHPEGDVDAGELLAAVGLESASLLTVLVRVEERYGFQWDDDLPAGSVASLDAIADTVLRQLEAANAAGEATASR